MATTINDVLTYGLRGIPRKVSQGIPRTTFLSKHFFGADGIMTAEQVVKIKARFLNRQAAGAAEWNSKGNILKNDDGYSYKFVKPVYLYDRFVITPEDLAHLNFDEDPANPLPYEQKLLLALAEKREELYSRQDTAVELLAMELLQYGTFDGQSYGLDAGMFIDADSDADGNIDETLNPIEWIARKLQKVYDKSGVMPNEIVCSPALVWDILTGTNAAVSSQLMFDYNRVQGGELEFNQYREDGVAFHGFIKVPGFGPVALLSYGGKYTASNGSQVNIFPDNAMLIGSRNCGCTNYAGVYSNAEGMKMSVPIAAKEFIHVVDGDGDIPANIAVCRQTNVALAPAAFNSWAFVSNVSSRF